MRSIRSALVLRLWLSFLGLLLLVGGALWIRLRSSLTQEFDETMAARGRAIATLVTARGGAIEFDFADEIMPEFSRPRAPEYFQLFLADDEVFERSRSLAGKDLALPASDAAADRWDLRLPDGRPGRALAIEFVPQLGDEHGPEQGPEQGLEHGVEHGESAGPTSASRPMRLVLARGREAIDRVMAAVTLWIVLSGVTLALVSALLVRSTVTRGLEPLQRFSEAIQTLRLSSLHSARLSTPLPAELEPLRARFVETLQRLAEAFEREKRFTAAAAHELRTPIAELKSVAQYALKWPEDPENARKTNEDVLALALRMERLVATLLSIARSAGSLEALQHEPVRIEPLVRSLCRSLDERARARGLAWELSLPGELEVSSDRAVLETLLVNLIENAVEHARGRTTIRVDAFARDGSVQLSVSNLCDGLTAADVRHVFEPFWRGPRSGTTAAHSGLGLTLASATAKALSAELEIELVDGGRFVARLRLPECRAEGGSSPHA